MAATLGVGVPPGAGGGGGAAPAAHLSDQTEEVGVAFLRADEVKKACEEFALKMKESTMAEMIRHYKKGLNSLIEIGAGGYPEATMTEVYQNSHYVEQVRETIVHTLMLERACDEMKDGSLHQSKLSEVQDQGSVVNKFEAVMDHPNLSGCRTAVKEYLKEDMVKKESAAATAHARGGALFQSTRFQALPPDSDKVQTKLAQYRLMQNIITAPDDQNKNLAHVRMALEKSLTLSAKSHDVDAT